MRKVIVGAMVSIDGVMQETGVGVEGEHEQQEHQKEGNSAHDKCYNA